MTDTHTPGPWTTRMAKIPSDTGWDYGIVATVDGLITCIGEAYDVVGRDVRAPAKANARLIAAAPDLLAALDAVMQEFGPGTMSDESFSRAVSALSRARGD